MVRLSKGNADDTSEKDLIDGKILLREGEANIIQNIKKNGLNSTFPLYQKKINLYEYEFLKTYLYALYEKNLTDDKISLNEFSALASNANPVIVAPTITSTDSSGLSLIENHSVYVHLEYEESKYQITVYIKLYDKRGSYVINHFVSVLGIEAASTKTNLLTDYLIKQAIKNSYYKNKILSVTCEEFDELDISELKIDKFKNESLDNIFIPEVVKSELKKFNDCVNNFEKIEYGLRYLLCGLPGTGKTKSVRSLINSLYGKVTILIAEGDIYFKVLFDFARLFSPVLICMDDLDLFVGSRETHCKASSLGGFLQELDGFEKNNIFLLATTNDKSLIDKAASRPGRFDMILDFGRLHKTNFLDLINSSTGNEFIIAIFDDELLDKLKKKNVTGAFIVNLVKQLEVKYKLDSGCDLRKYLEDILELSHRGFYKQLNEKEIGFVSNGEKE